MPPHASRHAHHIYIMHTQDIFNSDIKRNLIPVLQARYRGRKAGLANKMPKQNITKSKNDCRMYGTLSTNISTPYGVYPSTYSAKQAGGCTARL